MQYILPIIPIFLYFELLGQALFNTIGIKKMSVSFEMGFIAFIAIVYVVCMFPVRFNASFVLIMIIITLILLAGLILIIKNIRLARINYKQLAILFLIVMVFSIIYSQRSLGTLYYEDNISYLETNIEIIHGKYRITYALQGFYLFAAYFTQVLRIIYGLIGVDFLYISSYSWILALINYICEGTVLLNVIEILNIKDKKIIAFLSALILGVLGMLLHNVECAHVGNTYRTYLCAYLFIFSYLYFKERKKEYLLLLGTVCIGACSISYSNIYLITLFSFIFWYVACKNENVIGYVALWLLFPFINLLFVSAYTWNGFVSRLEPKIFLSLCIILILVIMFRDQVYKYINKTKVSTILLILVGAGLFVASIYISRGDINVFLNPSNYINAFVWQYYKYDSLFQIVGNIILLLPLIIIIIRYRKNEIYLIVTLLFVIFLSPLQTPIINEINPVFYRSYDLIINPFTLSMAYIELISAIKKPSNKVLLLTLLSTAVIFVDVKQFKNILENHTYDTKEDFNSLYKITNDEYDLTLFMKEYTRDNKYLPAKVITYFPAVDSEIYGMHRLYIRNKICEDKNATELAKIFYPAENFDKQFAPKNPDNKNVNIHLRNSDYSFVILDKSIEVNEHGDNYITLYNKLNQEFIPIYENSSYAIYHINKND